MVVSQIRREPNQHRFFWLSCFIAAVIVMAVLVVGYSSAYAMSDIPKAPTGPQRYVTDLGHLIPDEQEPELNAYLRQVDEAGVAQVAILTLPDTERDLSELSPIIMNAWGVGDKEKDNGILVLANAKRIQNNLSGNRIFVGTGYGVEGTLPDALVGRVLDEQALPAFEAKAYGTGLVNTTMTLVQILQGDEALTERYASSASHEAPPWVFILFIIVMILLRLKGVPVYFGPMGGGGFGGGGSSFGGGGFGGGRSGGGGAGR